MSHKKEYVFGELKSLDFNDIIQQQTPEADQLKIYAFIPLGCDGDGGGSAAAHRDVCISIN